MAFRDKDLLPGITFSSRNKQETERFEVEGEEGNGFIAKNRSLESICRGGYHSPTFSYKCFRAVLERCFYEIL